MADDAAVSSLGRGLAGCSSVMFGRGLSREQPDKRGQTLGSGRVGRLSGGRTMRKGCRCHPCWDDTCWAARTGYLEFASQRPLRRQQPQQREAIWWRRRGEAALDPAQQDASGLIVRVGARIADVAVATANSL